MNSRDLMAYQSNTPLHSTGQHIVARDSEWVIREVKGLSSNSQMLVCTGVSEFVLGLEFQFITNLEDKIDVLDPKETSLFVDQSPNYRDSRLFIESHIRRTVENDSKVHIANRAAIDKLDYQFEPARQTLKQPRQRILIADGVGIGKTIEAGILVSELIARGRGRRILVLAIKSMLLQFQKEFWNRFTIPLTRLDSRGIQQIKAKIPSNHNPFYFYDRSIISIDTVKSTQEYRNYIQDAYWDIIIIDEAHNVAKRGTQQSLRSKLAALIKDRSDTLIMLTATPHDGRAKSFASLINMLDPTAIANPEDFKRGDYADKGLVIRRFKKDIEEQVENSFHQIRQFQYEFQASIQEENVYRCLSKLRNFYKSSRRKSMFLGITFEKAFLSSPTACKESAENRLGKLKKQTTDRAAEESELLNTLITSLDEVRTEQFTKYQGLLTLIRKKKSGLNWNDRKNDDRLVIFTERTATLNWLRENLVQDLTLNPHPSQIFQKSLHYSL